MPRFDRLPVRPGRFRAARAAVVVVALCASVVAVVASAPVASADTCPVAQSGTWIGSWSSSFGGSGAAESTLNVSGSSVTGTMTFITGPTVIVPNSAITGTITCAALSGSVSGVALSGAISPDGRQISGTYSVFGDSGVWEASLVTQSASVSNGVSLTTDTGGTGATPTDPLQVTIGAGAPADLSIQSSSTGGATLSGYFLVGRLIRIVAPPVTGLPGVAPYSFGFTLDASSLGTATATDVAVFRNGVLVADCTSAPGATPTPDPCVAGRSTLPDGDVQISVTSTMASVWGLGLATSSGPPPGCGSSSLVTPSLSVGDATVLEGPPGTSTASVPITLSAISGSPVSVSVSTADGTAKAAGDYQAVPSTTVTIAPGACSASVDVSVVGDDVAEKTEKFLVRLSSPVGATLADTSATVNILDDDAPLSVYASDAQVTEGDSGPSMMDFSVSLSAPVPVGASVSVNATTLPGSATAGVDYSPLLTTALTFDAGEQTKTVEVAVTGDVSAEKNEVFKLALSAPVGAVIGDAAGLGTIVDDDRIGSPTPVLPSVSVGDSTVVEGDSGSTEVAVPVTLSSPATSPVSVTVASADGSATAPGDYVPVPPTTLTFDPGETSKSVSVSVVGDAVPEKTEKLSMKLTAPVGATLADPSAVLNVLDDDAPLALYVSDAARVEGNSGSAAMSFTVSLSAPVPGDQTVTVSLATANVRAVAGSDYSALPATVLTFAAGERTKTVVVTVLGDHTTEPNETFRLALSHPVGAALGDGSGIGTIVNDD